MKEINYHELVLNPVEVFRDDWMLVSAGKASKDYNTMTIGWGHLGCIWGMPTAIAYVRPERYTKEFMDKEEYFTLTWFGKKYRDELLYLGRKSGRDEDKVKKVGFTPTFDDSTVWFKEAQLVIICRKLYADEFHENCFVDHKVIETMYPDHRFHTAYYGEIVKILQQE